MADSLEIKGCRACRRYPAPLPHHLIPQGGGFAVTERILFFSGYEVLLLLSTATCSSQVTLHATVVAVGQFVQTLLGQILSTVTTETLESATSLGLC